MLKWNIPGYQCQYHGCRWPGSLRRQAINSHNIECMQWGYSCLPCKCISRICTISLLTNKCFHRIHSAQKGLNLRNKIWIGCHKLPPAICYQSLHSVWGRVIDLTSPSSHTTWYEVDKHRPQHWPLDYGIILYKNQYSFVSNPPLQITELILGLHLTNERRRYFVTTHLIGWVEA